MTWRVLAERTERVVMLIEADSEEEARAIATAGSLADDRVTDEDSVDDDFSYEVISLEEFEA